MCLHPDKRGGGFGLSSQTTKKSQSDCQRGEDREGGTEGARLLRLRLLPYIHSQQPPSLMCSFFFVCVAVSGSTILRFLPSFLLSFILYVYYLLLWTSFARGAFTMPIIEKRTKYTWYLKYSRLTCNTLLLGRRTAGNFSKLSMEDKVQKSSSGFSFNPYVSFSFPHSLNCRPGEECPLPRWRGKMPIPKSWENKIKVG